MCLGYSKRSTHLGSKIFINITQHNNGQTVPSCLLLTSLPNLIGWSAEELGHSGHLILNYRCLQLCNSLTP